MRRAVLSHPLAVLGLVGRYLTNYLIARSPIPGQQAFAHRLMRGVGLSGISSPFDELSLTLGYVRNALLALSPLYIPRRGLIVRLACFSHAASVQSEPGSNSSIENPLPRFGRTDPAYALWLQEKDLTCESRLGAGTGRGSALKSRSASPGSHRVRPRRSWAESALQGQALRGHADVCSTIDRWFGVARRRSRDSYRRREHILAAFPNCLLVKEEKNDGLG